MKKVYLLVSFLFTIAVSAQTPDLINYQGALRNNAGVPIINRAVSLQFELLQGSASGPAAFTETVTVNTNMLGLFSVRIGQNTGAGFSSVNWQNGPWFLAVSVDTSNADNFTLLGTQELVSVPFAMNARTAEEVSSSYTNNILTIAGNSYTLDPPLIYSAGAGISVSGATITNTAPDQTVTIQPSGNNVQVAGTYPDFTVSSSPQLSYDGSGNLSISDGNSVDITPTLSLTGNVLTSGPVSNSVQLPQSTVYGTGAASVNPGGASGYTVHVPPTQIAVTSTAGAAAASSVSLNNFNINIPAPQFDAISGNLTTGTNVANITPSVNFNATSGQLSVGPSSNSVMIPAAAATTLNVTGAAVSTASVGPTISLHVPPSTINITNMQAPASSSTVGANNFSINIPAPDFNPATGELVDGTSTLNITPSANFNPATGLLTVGPASNSVTIPVTNLTVTGAAQVTSPNGPSLALSVPPSTVVVSNAQAPASSSTLGTNHFSINIPAPDFNPVTGELVDGTSTLVITPSVSFNSGNRVLTVGPAANNVTLPAIPTITAAGIASVFGTTDYTVGVQQPTFTPAGNASLTGTWPSYTINTTARTVTGTGLADVTVAGNTVTVSVPTLTYEPSNGELVSGTNTTIVAPTVTLNAGVLRVGPGSNSVDISPVSPWAQNGSSVTLVTPSNYVGIGTTDPAEMLQVGSFSTAQDVYLAMRTQGGNLQKAGIKLNHSNTTDGFTIESNEITNRLDFIRHAIGSSTVLSIDRLADRIGIGTTAPSASLHIAGSFRLEDGNEGANKVLTSDAFGNATWRTPVAAWTTTGNAGTNAATDFIGTTDGAPLVIRIANFERARFQGSSFAIGTATPNGVFHTEVTNGRFRVHNFPPGSGAIAGSLLLAELTGNIGLGPQLRFQSDGNSNYYDIGENGAFNFVIERNDSPRLSVGSNGFVGVGTATAGTQLEVNGDISIPTSAKMTFGTNGTGTSEWIKNVSGGLGFFTNSLQRVQLDNNGNMGIGTLGPDVKLEVWGAETSTDIYANGGSPNTTFRITNNDNSSGGNFAAVSFATRASNNGTYESAKIAAVHVNHAVPNMVGDLAFLTRGSTGLHESMRVTGAGHVGINTSAPTASLHVNGTTRLQDGTEGAGKVLTSDAQGNASWQVFGGMTAGMVMAFAGPTTNIPTGWLLCDGSVVSRTTYSVLFSTIGTAWGSGTSTATFHLPDMRGMFLRGVDGSRNLDPDKNTRVASNTGGNTGNNVGSAQDDAFENHNHATAPFAAGQSPASLGLGSPVLIPGGPTATGGSSSGESETRPKNVYVYYIIKT